MRIVSSFLLVVACAACSSTAESPPAASGELVASTSTAPSASDDAAQDPSPPSSDPPASGDGAHDLSWLDAYGAGATAPALPPDWQLINAGPVGFAVPQGWQVPNGYTCLEQGTPGYVLLAGIVATASTCGTPTAACPVGACGQTDAHVVISPATDAAPTTPPDARIGTFDAWRLADSPIETYRLTNGVEVAVVGPDAAQILATFTDSNPRRALQTGALADTSTWKTVSFGGVALLVPPRWELLDLAHQDISHGFFPDPGTCQEPWFWPAYPRALIDVSDPHISVSCIAVVELPVRPEEGVWIRDGAVVGPVATEGVIDGMSVSVLDRPLPSDAASANPLVDVIVRNGTRTLRVSIGVGLDPSIARTILRTLHRS